MRFAAGLAYEIKGETVPATPGNIHMTIRQPYGVVGRIIPFNHPIKFAANALAAPLIAGNCVVLKPPETSPLSATMLGEICREVMPAGVVNIVTGLGLPAGDAIARHPDVKRIAFTGSVPTGRAIQRAAAEGGIKHVTLELGGKNPLIAFPDMDPDTVAKIAVAGMNFAWQGQSCGSTSRLLLHEDLYKPVLERVVERVKSLRLADPLDDNAQMGPINSKRHYERVVSMVQSGVSDGAKLMAGGKRPGGNDFARGYWLEPTVFADVNPDMRIAKEEIFGPVLSVFRWKDEKEALQLANSTEYGLTASIFTNDLKTAFRTAKAVKSGYIWINGASGHFYGTPFGGLKNSGLGREEGIDELLSYTEVKTIHVMLGDIQARD
jgi:aldehyde dehydrogenase (NAD+)/betaine-aldehyde dehydrogenase